MERLGALLVGAGLLTGEQLAEGLRAQVMFGGRLGTNLLELGFVDLEMLARALGTQHGLPAALTKHFEEVDVELQQRLSPETARRFECVPLRHVFGTRHGVVLAATGPLASRQLEAIAEELLVQPGELIIAVAAEMRVKYFLERVYQIPRAPRFLRVRGSIPPLATTATHEQERRRYLDERADEVLRENYRLARGSRELIPFVRAGTTPPLPPVDHDDAQVPAGALDAIRAASDRDQLAAALLDAIDRHALGCDAASLLLVRRETAIGWRGFSRLGAPVPEVVVPLKYQGLVPRAVTSCVAARLPFAALHPVDQMLMHMLGKDHGDLAIVPIVVASHAPSVVACAMTPGANVGAIHACAGAAAAAIGRLVRAADIEVAEHAVRVPR
jgi:hypothetical protein